SSRERLIGSAPGPRVVEDHAAVAVRFDHEPSRASRTRLFDGRLEFRLPALDERFKRQGSAVHSLLCERFLRLLRVAFAREQLLAALSILGTDHALPYLRRRSAVNP